MPPLAKIIRLSAVNTAARRAIIRKGTHKSRRITRGRTVLLLGAAKSHPVIEAELGISAGQYWRTRGRYLAGGLNLSPGRAALSASASTGASVASNNSKQKIWLGEPTETRPLLE